jgi:hypothetical protein
LDQKSVDAEFARHLVANHRSVYTNVLFHHHSLGIDRHDITNFRVSATHDIAKGALLLVEQAMSGSAKDLVAMISVNNLQYNSFCPREVGDRSVLAFNKMEANCFHYQNQAALVDPSNPWYCVGNSLSCFNHRCSPNAIVHQVVWHAPKISALPVTFFVIYAFADIAAGEEICISYGKIIGHSKKQKPEIRCQDPSCTPQQRAAPLEKSARAGLDEHWTYLKAFVKTKQFKLGLVYRQLADDGCYFVGCSADTQSQTDDESDSIESKNQIKSPLDECDVILNRRFLKTYDGHFDPPTQAAFIREKFAQLLSRVSAGLDRISPESMFV